ncbi:MAG: tRNA uridine-5-carboxymethylaminomethyl(34) synthesis GTPase MnmE, partial [Bacteroidales bacterium]|nr:tRNA uridine-5-carboxymethylaminomethyl(34) synthesis GTPase MnmE [Bacteroidales bacterium]
GSLFIQQKIIELLLNHGCRLARPGEFTLRAYLNGKFDLSQAEAVADLIAANSQAAHDLALNQMRGGFSVKIKELRGKLIDFTSLLELELDFSEDDVEFADRKQLVELLSSLKEEIARLIDSFSAGNVLKTGIPVAIIGKPNVGKSTLLNAILNEERAIVSEIPGTTRDIIEDTIIIDGVSFRFIDTAGIRKPKDEIEAKGIEKTYEKINQAKIILYVCDVSDCLYDEIKGVVEDFKDHLKDTTKRWILIGNKVDKLISTPKDFRELVDLETIFVSAKRRENIHMLTSSLRQSVDQGQITDQTLVSNTRHYEALKKSLESLEDVEQGFHNNLPTDLVTIDLKQALHYLGEITGEITTDEILGNIFGRFCIGK